VKTIPAEVIKAAENDGCNSVSYCGTCQGEEVYSIGFVDSEGQPVPTGLPVFILYKDGNIRMVRGMETLYLDIEED
jgi:hypothetical protein